MTEAVLLVRQADRWPSWAEVVRDLDVIDRELGLLALVRSKTREASGRPSMVGVDELLAERQSVASEQGTSNI